VLELGHVTVDTCAWAVTIHSAVSNGLIIDCIMVMAVCIYTEALQVVLMVDAAD
jgi:hypothetical protein